MATKVITLHLDTRTLRFPDLKDLHDVVEAKREVQGVASVASGGSEAQQAARTKVDMGNIKFAGKVDGLTLLRLKKAPQVTLSCAVCAAQRPGEPAALMSNVCAGADEGSGALAPLRPFGCLRGRLRLLISLCGQVDKVWVIEGRTLELEDGTLNLGDYSLLITGASTSVTLTNVRPPGAAEHHWQRVEWHQMRGRRRGACTAHARPKRDAPHAGGHHGQGSQRPAAHGPVPPARHQWRPRQHRPGHR